MFWKKLASVWGKSIKNIYDAKNCKKKSDVGSHSENEMTTAFRDEKELKLKKKRFAIGWFFRSEDG